VDHAIELINVWLLATIFSRREYNVGKNYFT
jgi:hypothetical protein